MPLAGFVPPPYPYDRLDALEAARRLAARAASSTARSARRAIRCPRSRAAPRPTRSRASNGYPPSAGSAALRDAAARVDRPPLRRRGRRARTSARASARRSSSPSLPHLLRLRNPRRDTVLYPAIAYPTLRDGRDARRLRAVPVPLDADWHLDLDAITPADAERALVLWVNEPGNPASSVAGDAYFAARRGVGPGARRRGRERRVLRRVRARRRDDPLAPASTACSRCTACRSARTSRACASASTRAIPTSSTYLVETRKHAGLMAPTAGAGRGGGRARRRRARRRAARALRRTPRARRATRSRRTGSCTTAATRCSTCGCAPPTAPTTAGRSRPGSRTRRGCSSRPAISTARPAPITCGSRSCSPRDRLELALDRIEPNLTEEHGGRRREADDAVVGGRRRLARRHARSSRRTTRCGR